MPQDEKCSPDHDQQVRYGEALDRFCEADQAVRPELLDSVAEDFGRAAETGSTVPKLTTKIAGLDIDTAYRIQFRTIRRRMRLGGLVRGHKVGLTSRAMQEQLGVSEPDSGFLFLDDLKSSGVGLDLQRLNLPRVEAEIGLVLGRDLVDKSIDKELIMNSIESVFLALEIIDTRFADWNISLPESIADNASSGLAICGPGRPVLGSESWEQAEISLRINNRSVAQGYGRAVLGDPINAVMWLAKRLNYLGTGLHAGDTVLTGAVHASVPLPASSEITANADGFEPVSCHTIPVGDKR